MKSIAILTLFSFFLFIGCTLPDKRSKIFTTDNLPSKQYTINVDKDTTLETANGALLKIPKGALKPASGNTVTLEIKEAYSIRQMIQAGLVTESNGELLSSGGMIYINSVGNENVTFAQAIKVAIPADYLQKGMQLYKGEQRNGNINWMDATSLPENKQLTAIDTGKILFQSKCASCHAIDHDLTGPALAHFPKRIPYQEGTDKYWFHYFKRTYTPYSVDPKTARVDSLYNERWSDPYACNLINRYGLMAPEFNLSWSEWQDVYAYIQNESDTRNLPLPAHAYLKNCTDSCDLYKGKIRDLQQQKMMTELKRRELIQGNGPLVKVTPDTTWQRNDNLPLPPDFDKKVSPNYYDAVYYQFSVESFGWFNVDMMMKNVEGVQESELFAKIVGDYHEKIKTFLIIPSVKTYAEGGPAERNPEEFAFYHKDGKIPLPQNTDAFLLAVTETDSSIAYGLKKFTTSKQQEIEVVLHASSKEEFIEAMKDFDAARLHIKVADSKNATEIRRTDTTVRQINTQLKEAEKLKPKNCDCDCGISDKPLVSEVFTSRYYSTK